MPISNYSALKGRPINNRLATGKAPHYQILVSADGELYRIAVNVRSDDGSEVEYLVHSHFEHPITDAWQALAVGLTPLESTPGGAAIDFIRENIAQPWEFKPLPMSAAGPDNDLNEKIDSYVQRAMSDEVAELYAFGSVWGPEAKADNYFGFKPGRGIHDIHMNQGNPPHDHDGDNGVWQDGALVFHFPGDSQWVGVFLKFRTQAWHSDDAAATQVIPADPEHPGLPHTPINKYAIPTLEVPDGLVRIVAAYVNDVRTPEHETVTLLNTSDRPADLTGWSLKDKQKNATPLAGLIAAGATMVVDVRSPMALSNNGGIITLLDARGIKVHGVSYTKAQARQPGRTIPFQ